MRGMKVNVLSAAIAVVLIWPLIHAVMVRMFDVNSWKFGGWAMYSRLGPHVEVSIYRGAVSQADKLDLATMPAAVQSAAREYRDSTSQYGTLVRPDALSTAALNAVPARAVVVQRDSFFLDAETDRLAIRRTLFTYPRGGRRSSSETTLR
jgi:hypothetical protein